jgi:hypothetical protein
MELKTRTVTREQAVVWYEPEDRKQASEWYAAREVWTAHQIINEIGVKHDFSMRHLVWMILHPELLTEQEMRMLACKWVERALARLKSPDPRSVNAIAVARRYAVGQATDRELDDARVDAWRAANCKAGLAAWYVTSRDFGDCAAWDAAHCAMWAAANAVAGDVCKSVLVAWDTQIDAMEAEAEQQLRDMLDVIEGVMP